MARKYHLSGGSCRDARGGFVPMPWCTHHSPARMAKHVTCKAGWYRGADHKCHRKHKRRK